MKILIFYSKTGSGHLRAAKAIAKQIQIAAPNAIVTLVDGLEQKRFGISFSPSTAFSLLSGPLLFFYNISFILTNNALGLPLLQHAIKWFWGGNYKNIIETENPDLIISTHHFISPTTTPMTITKPYFVVVSDLGFPHRVWFDSSATVIVPTEEMATYAKTFVQNPVHVVALDFPIEHHPSMQHVQTKRANAILVIGGGSGSGGIQTTVRQLTKNFPDKKIVAVCGRNQRLFNALSKNIPENLEVLGYMEHMEPVYEHIDIVVTKAGPTTIVEAVMYKKPLVITGWVGMQEKGNVDFVINSHVGFYSPNAKDLATCITQIYEHFDLFILEKPIFTSGTKKIVEYMLPFFPTL